MASFEAAGDWPWFPNDQTLDPLESSAIIISRLLAPDRDIWPERIRRDELVDFLCTYDGPTGTTGQGEPSLVALERAVAEAWRFAALRATALLMLIGWQWHLSLALIEEAESALEPENLQASLDATLEQARTLADVSAHARGIAGATPAEIVASLRDIYSNSLYYHRMQLRRVRDHWDRWQEEMRRLEDLALSHDRVAWISSTVPAVESLQRLVLLIQALYRPSALWQSLADAGHESALLAQAGVRNVPRDMPAQLAVALEVVELFIHANGIGTVAVLPASLGERQPLSGALARLSMIANALEKAADGSIASSSLPEHAVLPTARPVDRGIQAASQGERQQGSSDIAATSAGIRSTAVRVAEELRQEGASPPTTSAQERSPKSLRRRWSTALKRFAIAFGYAAAAVIAIAGLLTKVSPSILSQALSTFFGWPLVLQSLAALGALILLGAVASGKQIYQAMQNRQLQTNTRMGVSEALLSDVVPYLKPLPTGIARIVGLLESWPSVFTPNAPDTSKMQSGVVVNEDAPSRPRSANDQIKPHDDVQLSAPTIFINRESELKWLTRRLLAHKRDGDTGDTTVVVGIPGIGKTALVAKAVEQVKDQRFDGNVAYVYCAGMRDPVAIVRNCLERVDPKRRIPLTFNLETLRQISEELLADREFLIILDGVEPHTPLGEVVRALRTDQRLAHILITTTTTPSLNVAPVSNQWHLAPLDTTTTPDGAERDEALELFAQYAGKESAKELGERTQYAAEIVDALERHTYALQLMGAYMQGQLNILKGVAAEVKRLKDGVVTPGVDGVLTPVWVALTTIVNDLPEEARILLFAFVAAFGGTEAGRRATRALGQALELQDVDNAIRALVQFELMQSFETTTMPEHSDHHRLRIHTLLRVYLSKRVAEPDWEARSTQAKDAVTAFYARYIKWYDHRDPARATQRALSPDAENMTNALEWAIRRNQHECVVALAHGMRRFWHDRWLNDKTLRYMPTAVASATLLADRARQAKRKSDEEIQREYAADLAFTLGRVYRRIGRLPDAEPLFRQDLLFRQRHRRYAAQAEALHQLAQLERSRGQMGKALRYCRRGLAVVRWHMPRRPDGSSQKVRDLLQARALLIAQYGRIERSRGYLKRADILFAEAFQLFKETGDLLEQGVALGYRGRIARVLGNIEKAQEFFARSSDLAREVYDFRGIGVIATQLGRIARTRGDIDSAERAFTEGLNKALQVSDKQAVAVNLNYLGRIANSRGNTLEAEDYFNRSLQIAREIGDRLHEGVNLGYLGRVARQRDFLPGARTYFKQSIKILREVEDRRGQAVILAELARVNIQSRHLIRAGCELRRSLRLIGLVGDKRNEGTILLIQGQLDYAKGDTAAARRHVSASLERAKMLEDVSDIAEAQQWLDTITEATGNTSRG